MTSLLGAVIIRIINLEGVQGFSFPGFWFPGRNDHVLKACRKDDSRVVPSVAACVF